MSTANINHMTNKQIEVGSKYLAKVSGKTVVMDTMTQELKQEFLAARQAEVTAKVSWRKAKSDLIPWCLGRDFQEHVERCDAKLEVYLAAQEKFREVKARYDAANG